MEQKREPFLGLFFDKSAVLRLSRWAGMLAWVILGIYLVTTSISLTRFLIQYSSGLYFEKGITPLDMLDFFTPYLVQPLPGIIHFFGLKFAQNALLILMEMEESARRSARPK